MLEIQEELLEEVLNSFLPSFLPSSSNIDPFISKLDQVVSLSIGKTLAYKPPRLFINGANTSNKNWLLDVYVTIIKATATP